jgi:YggT family protein
MAGVLWLLIRLIDLAFSVYIFILIARTFLPLVGADPYNPIAQFIYRITEPLLAPLRRWTIYGNYDFAPLAVMIGLMIVRQLIISLLYSLSALPF